MEKKRAMSRDKFEQLTPETLADLYTNRPSRKRVIIDEFLETLESMRDVYIEEAVEVSKMKDAKEVLDRIMKL